MAIRPILNSTRLFRRMLLTGGLLLAAGCGSSVSNRVGSIESNPQGAAEKVLELYDANSDGSLGLEELKRSPALRSAMKRIDTNGDKKMSLEEIVARFKKYASLSTHMAGDVSVVRKGRPVIGVEVIIEPEPFMGSAVPTFHGTVGEEGIAPMTSDPVTGGFPVGFYRVSIKQGTSSKALPSAVSEGAAIGCEIIDDSNYASRIQFDLGS